MDAEMSDATSNGGGGGSGGFSPIHRVDSAEFQIAGSSYSPNGTTLLKHNLNGANHDNLPPKSSSAHNGNGVNMTPMSSEQTQRITMGTWHPKENNFAVAKHNSLFIYTEKR